MLLNYDKTSCIRVHNSGLAFQDITCLYPFLGSITSQWEKNFDWSPGLTWMRKNAVWVPLTTVTIYLLFCYFGPLFMNSRSSFQRRKSLAAWNLCLSLFSTLGFVRVFPQLIHNYLTSSVKENLCTDPRITYGSGATGLWVWLFIMSKFPELIDTFFLVIHKKPVIFLHWYHHVTVLLYCWHSYVINTTTGIWFCAMNYAVHGIMYFYYFLMAIKCKPKWFNPIFITYAQISQMFVGVAITAVAFYFQANHGDATCIIKLENNIAASIMYGSYLLLFLHFFFARYFKSKATVKSKRL